MVDEKKPDAENANDAKTPAGETAKDISKAKVDDNHFDEDDDFEEFPANEWKGSDTEAVDADDEEVNAWEDNWDDEGDDEDFSKQLRAELEKAGHVPMQT